MYKGFSDFIHSISKYEVYFFYSLAFVSLLPIILFDAFLTVDGPAHLYNSKLIIELLSNNTSVLADYYKFNDLIITNWLGHFFLSSLMLVFPALIAEKIVLSFYILLLPLSFRFLAKSLSIKENYSLYFIFPFTYTFLFYYGFYNFHIGMVLLFLCLGLWIKQSKSSLKSAKGFLLLLFLSLLLFFSHIFVFVILVFTIGVFILFELIISPQSKEKFKFSFGKAMLMFSPGIILLLVYLFHQEVISDTEFYFSSFSESWVRLQNIEPAKAVSYGKEGTFTKWIFILFIIILANLLYIRLKDIKAPISTLSLLTGTLCGGLLISFFVMPNGSTFISERILVFYFLFFILFIGTLRVSKWVRIVSFILINYVNIALLKVYTKAAKETNAIVCDILAASEQIEPYSTVLPINENGYWLLGHASNYLGIYKPIIILENYEATTNYFPLVWNMKKIPFLHLGDSNLTMYNYPHNKSNATSKIDYVFLISNQEEEEVNFLDITYDLIYWNEERFIKLYKKSD